MKTPTQSTAPHHFFKLRNSPQNLPQGKIIALPYIDIPRQKEVLKLFRDHYNSKIRVKRALAKAQGTPFKEKEDMQLLKPSHFNLMSELALIACYQMKKNNRYLAAEGMQQVDPTLPYSVWVSNPQLMDHTGAGSNKTIWRGLKRLIECGFLVAKEFHGRNREYELLINPDLLLIFDLTDGNYTGKAKPTEKTVECAFPKHLRTKLHHIEFFNSSLDNNSIKPEGILFNTSQNDSISFQESIAKKKAPERCSEISDPGEIKRELKARFLSGKKVIRAEECGGLKNYAFVQTVLFLQAAVKMLWPNRLYEGYKVKVEDYISENYFSACKNESQIDRQIEALFLAVKETKKFIDRDPVRRFAKLPLEYFDLRQRPKKQDYSGFRGIQNLLKEKEEFRKLEPERFTKNKALSQLRRWIKDYEKNPTLRRSTKLTEKVIRELPIMIPYLADYHTKREMP